MKMKEIKMSAKQLLVDYIMNTGMAKKKGKCLPRVGIRIKHFLRIN